MNTRYLRWLTELAEMMGAPRREVHSGYGPQGYRSCKTPWEAFCFLAGRRV